MRKPDRGGEETDVDVGRRCGSTPGSYIVSLANVQVIADFDHTLSKAFENGQRCRTSHGIFDFESEKKNPDFAKKVCRLVQVRRVS